VEISWNEDKQITTERRCEPKLLSIPAWLETPSLLASLSFLLAWNSQPIVMVHSFPLQFPSFSPDLFLSYLCMTEVILTSSSLCLLPHTTLPMLSHSFFSALSCCSVCPSGIPVFPLLPFSLSVYNTVELELQFDYKI
jgi:hypothetical protein